MAILLLMSEGDGKREPSEADPEKLAKLLEIELMQKRASWQQAKARRGSLRALSLFFLFAVIVAAAAAFYFIFSPGRVTELRSQIPTAEAEPTPSPTPALR